MKEIAIIGGAGKMGLWFTNYFTKKYYDGGVIVSVYDISKEPLIRLRNVRVANSVQDCVKTADMVIICVPVQKAVPIIKDCVTSMKHGAILAEISSVKSKTFRALAKLSSKVQPLCIHPMFGPGADINGGLKILIVPVRDKEKELLLLRNIFERAVPASSLTIKVLNSAAEHDKSIAVVLGLTYFANIVFAKILAKEDISLLRDVSGTTFGLQLLLSESILTDEPELISALIAENPQVVRYVREYINQAQRLVKLTGSGKSSNKDQLKKSIEETRSGLKKKENLDLAYRNMYKLIDQLKRLELIKS